MNDRTKGQRTYWEKVFELENHVKSSKICSQIYGPLQLFVARWETKVCPELSAHSRRVATTLECYRIASEPTNEVVVFPRADIPEDRYVFHQGWYRFTDDRFGRQALSIVWPLGSAIDNEDEDDAQDGFLEYLEMIDNYIVGAKRANTHCFGDDDYHTWAWRIVDRLDSLGRLEWTDHVDYRLGFEADLWRGSAVAVQSELSGILDHSRAVGSDKGGERLEEAKDFIVKYLGFREAEWHDLRDCAHESAIAEKTLRRARDELQKNHVIGKVRPAKNVVLWRLL